LEEDAVHVQVSDSLHRDFVDIFPPTERSSLSTVAFGTAWLDRQIIFMPPLCQVV
jgi:hypothetical protein